MTLNQQIIGGWLVGGGAVWLLSCAVRALPAPAANGNRFYVFVYNLAHFVGANFEKIVAADGTPSTLTVSPVVLIANPKTESGNTITHFIGGPLRILPEDVPGSEPPAEK